MRWPTAKPAGLGVAAMSYVAVDYLRHISPTWHAWLQPTLWFVLALLAIARIFHYKHWSAEFRAVIPFVASMFFMLAAFAVEVIAVRSVTAVLGLDWHRNATPLPDTGQWLLLALNEKLPQAAVDILRAHIVGLHHFLMLFIMMAFSVLFDSVKAPGFGLGARYMFTMGIGRLLRVITFVSTIVPSPRPWCAINKYKFPAYPHPWAQKYYVPYASDVNAISKLIKQDLAYVDIGEAIVDNRPDWGKMSFLADFLRTTAAEGPKWYSVLKRAEGGCNDLVFSGHMLVAALTAMAWTEAYGGISSALIWLLVIHSAQREIRERHHYSVDVIVAIYVGILLWKMTGFIWSNQADKKLTKLEKIQGRLIQAAKDSDIDEVRELLKAIELSNEENNSPSANTRLHTRLLHCATVFIPVVLVVLCFVITSDG